MLCRDLTQTLQTLGEIHKMFTLFNKAMVKLVSKYTDRGDIVNISDNIQKFIDTAEIVKSDVESIRKEVDGVRRDIDSTIHTIKIDENLDTKTASALVKSIESCVDVLEDIRIINNKLNFQSGVQDGILSRLHKLEEIK